MKRGALSSLIPGGAGPAAHSPLHRLPAEYKLLFALLLMVASALVPGRLLWLPALPVMAALLAAGASPLASLGRLKNFFWFLLAVVLFPALFTPQAQGADSLLPLVSAEGLLAGLYSALRMAVLFLIAHALSLTTPAFELVAVAERAAARAPWCKAGMRDFFRTGILAIQALPPLCQEADRLLAMEAESRREGEDRVWRKARRAARLLAPLVVMIFTEPERFAAGAAPGERREQRASAGEG